jgi:uncharacterized protein (DUF433 family)
MKWATTHLYRQINSSLPEQVRQSHRRQWPMNPLLERISIDPNVCFGKPCIRGTRIWVSLILDFLANGMSMEELLAEYPQLEMEDIRAAIAYGAEMARERYVEIPTEVIA